MSNNFFHEDIYSSSEFTSIAINPFTVVKVVKFIKDEEAVKKGEDDARKLLQNKFKMNHEVTKISLEKIMPFNNSDIKFNQYTLDDHENLKDSIKRFGLFSPIILWESPMGHYLILSGLERVKCYLELFKEAMDSKNENNILEYTSIPSFVIDFDGIDDLRARDIIVDSNLCTRRMDAISYSNAIAAKVAIKIADKKLRQDLNIMDEIGQEMMRSKPTLYGYKKLQNLCTSAAFLLQRNTISLKSARKLAGYSKEVQMALINHIGLDNVNDLKISVFNPSENPSPRELQGALKVAKECEQPFFSKIVIRVATKHLNDIKDKIQEALNKIPKDYLVKIRFPKLQS